jgi:hypothetical protein
MIYLIFDAPGHMSVAYEEPFTYIIKRSSARMKKRFGGIFLGRHSINEVKGAV